MSEAPAVHSLGGVVGDAPFDVGHGLAMPTVDVRAHALARAQYGRATRRQLRAAGVSDTTITRRIADGVWTEPVPGVVDLGTHGVSWRGRLMELLLGAGPHAWASHATAAYLHRFLDVRQPSDLDVLVPRTRHRKVGGHRLRSTRAIGADEVTTRHGLACTTPARTLLDLAATQTPDDLERWLLHAVRQDRTLPDGVLTLVDRHRTVPGRRRLIEVTDRLPADVHRIESPLEVLGVQRLVALGAPPFVLQHVVRDLAGAWVKRADVAWVDHRTLLEFDGAAYHDLIATRSHDAQVRAQLRALGWYVEVVRRADLDGPILPALVARLRGGPGT